HGDLEIRRKLLFDRGDSLWDFVVAIIGNPSKVLIVILALEILLLLLLLVMDFSIERVADHILGRNRNSYSVFDLDDRHFLIHVQTRESFYFDSQMMVSKPWDSDFPSAPAIIETFVVATGGKPLQANRDGRGGVEILKPKKRIFIFLIQTHGAILLFFK